MDIDLAALRALLKFANGTEPVVGLAEGHVPRRC